MDIHLISGNKLQSRYCLFPVNFFRIIFLLLAARVAVTMRIIAFLFGVSVRPMSVSVGCVIELVVKYCDLLH
jgi:hypothetical protein